MKDTSSDDLEDKKPPVVKRVPMQSIALSDLSSFKTDGKNWKIAGDVYSDFTSESSFDLSEGSGILANDMTSSDKSSLASAFEHGDMELEFEYFLPKGSNSGIYFQERYELQLFDSYGEGKPRITDSGSIYERWDDTKPEGSKGFEGSPASVNVNKSPGLWQKMQVFFRAPRFDAEGNKIRNAEFQHVFHNGVKIQNKVQVSGPTRGGKEGAEAAFAPFFIQGDHGKVAFRNIKYKAYTQDSLSLSDLTYQYFELPDKSSFPDFDTVKIVKSGSVDFLDVNVANAKEDDYGLIFKGSLKVPVAGPYLFETGIDEGGDLLIDGEMVVHNDGGPGYGWQSQFIDLSQGDHAIEVRFHDQVWNARLEIFYEGPSMSRRQLGKSYEKKTTDKVAQKGSGPIKLVDLEKTQLLRCFVNYKNAKRTHAIAVGSPNDVHYAYDLKGACLLNFWRGDFADVTRLWKGRGQQTMVPLNAAIVAEDGVPIEGIEKEKMTYLGYDLDASGRPVFSYKYGATSWTDKLEASEDGRTLKRTIRVDEDLKAKKINLARGKDITLRPNGWYTVDGQYFLRTEQAEVEEGGLVAFPNEEGEVTYELYW